MIYILDYLFNAAHWLIVKLEPAMVSICFLAAWGLVLLMGWNTVSGLRRGVDAVKKLHQIPCSSCRFYTGSYHLKCTLHPKIALSENAIDCRDYEADQLYG